MLVHTYEQPKIPDRVVILGANGFVGKKLKLFLENRNVPLLALSRTECDLQLEQSIAYLSDILKPTDSVVFLSAITPDKGKDTATFMKNCQMGYVVQQALKQTPVGHLIYFSSDAVYFLNDQITNELTSAAPQDLYGLMHRCREVMMEELKVPLAILRPTIIFGVGDTHNSYGPNRFIREAKAQSTIRLFGEGEEKRSHIFIEDVIRVTIEVLERKSQGVLNLCTNPSISFMEVAQMIKQNITYPVEIESAKRQSAITHRHFDLTGIYQSFPEIAFTPLETALKDTLMSWEV